MRLLQRILLIPSLLPLVAVLVLSSLHRGEPTRLHLLGWSSPEAPLGVWTALAATGAAALSASSSLLIFPRNQPLRRRLHRPYEAPSTPEWQVDGAQPPQDRSPVPTPPQRDLRDPAPTVAVAYRVIKRGVPHQKFNNFASEGTDQPVREPVPSRVSNPSSQESTEKGASDWGDDPNRDW
jgi:hypothetical protein